MVRREFRPRRRRALGLLAGAPAALAVNPAMSAPSPLITRPIPSSGERLPVIGLGTWQTFDVGGDERARAPLREVLSAMAADGAKLIDSSPMYGSSESVVGDLVAELKLRAAALPRDESLDQRPRRRDPPDGAILQAAARRAARPDAGP